MRRNLSRTRYRIPHSVRVLDRKLATTQGRSRYLDGSIATLPPGFTKDLAGRGVRVQAIGRLNELPPECQDQLQHAITTTANNKQLTAVLAVNYSGRTEIIDAIQRLAKEVDAGKLRPDAIDAELFSSFLDTRDLPDPDLLIRTSGEMRISNFLLWQVSYTEMYVIPKLWPDFNRQDLVDAIDEYNRRQRRYGGV